MWELYVKKDNVIRKQYNNTLKNKMVNNNKKHPNGTIVVDLVDKYNHSWQSQLKIIVSWSIIPRAWFIWLPNNSSK